jgi:hypothetical protein
MIGSGFIAAFQSATIEIFSAKIRGEMRNAPPQPLRRRKPKSPLETPGVIGPYLWLDAARLDDLANCRSIFNLGNYYPLSHAVAGMV